MGPNLNIQAQTQILEACWINKKVLDNENWSKTLADPLPSYQYQQTVYIIIKSVLATYNFY